MDTNSVTLNPTQQPTQTGQLVPPTSTELYNPNSWLRNGDSPAEIILSIAILIGAIAGLLSVLVPVMTQGNPNKKR